MTYSLRFPLFELSHPLSDFDGLVGSSVVSNSIALCHVALCYVEVD